MSNTVNQAAAAGQLQVTGQRQAAKTDDGKFQSMLSDALNGKAEPQAPVNPPKAAEETAQVQSEPTKTELRQETQTKPQDTQEETEEDDETVEYGQNAVIAAMQMQVIPQIPFTVEAPQEQTESSVTAIETADSGQIQTAENVTTAAAVLQTQTDLEPVKAADTETLEIPATGINTAQAATETARVQTQAAEQAPEPEQVLTQAEVPGGNIHQAAEAVSTRTAARPEANRHTENARTTARPEREAKIPVEMKIPEEVKVSEEMKIPEEIKTELTDAQVVIQPQPLSHMQIGRRHVQTSGTEQTRFDNMLAKATQELNPVREIIKEQPVVQVETDAAEITPKIANENTEAIANEIPEETAAAGQTVNVETKPETAEPRKAYAPQRATEQKPQATVQKSEKTPVTVQRPQKEVTKADEAVLGMVQPKAPEYTTEVIRQEPVLTANPVHIPEQAEQVKAQLIQNLETEKMEFQMQLKPKELGKVDVKMILESGKLSVEISAVNPKSAEMLARQAESLVASLKESGIDVSSVNVVTANENASAEMNGEFNLNNFRDQTHGQEQNTQGANHGRGQRSGGGQKELETREAPQRILNYAI